LFNTLIPRRTKAIEEDSAAVAPRRREVEPAPVVKEQSDRAVPGAERVDAHGSGENGELDTRHGTRVRLVSRDQH
jgi:hypothetical protein